MCPTFEYSCIGCGNRIEVVSSFDAKPGSIECPECQSDAFYSPTFSCSVGPTAKMWAGRREVNFKTDNRRDIARKQTEAYVQSGKFDKYVERCKCDKVRKAHLIKGLEHVRKIAPPIKVDL